MTGALVAGCVVAGVALVALIVLTMTPSEIWGFAQVLAAGWFVGFVGLMAWSGIKGERDAAQAG